MYVVIKLSQIETNQDDGIILYLNKDINLLFCSYYLIFVYSLYLFIFLLLYMSITILVEAISNVKFMNELKRNWQGDPCAVVAFLWDAFKPLFDQFIQQKKKKKAMDKNEILATTRIILCMLILFVPMYRTESYLSRNHTCLLQN